MSAYTPGPWHAREWNCHGPTTVGIGDGADFQLVAECNGSPFSNEVIDANAQLIVAAPELLEALKGVLRVADRDTEEFAAARAAVAKAEGWS